MADKGILFGNTKKLKNLLFARDVGQNYAVQAQPQKQCQAPKNQATRIYPHPQQTSKTEAETVLVTRHWNLEPRLLTKMLAKIRFLTLSFVLLYY